MGEAVIEAVSTQRLSRFNLDLRLRATRVEVDGQRADFVQRGVQELVVTPADVLRSGRNFEVTVDYRGKPDEIRAPDVFDPWLSNRRSALALGEPEVAAW